MQTLSFHQWTESQLMKAKKAETMIQLLNSWLKQFTTQLNKSKRAALT